MFTKYWYFTLRSLLNHAVKVIIMKQLILKSLSILSFFFIGKYGNAQSGAIYSPDKSITLPGDGGYDYLAIDYVNRHLFVSHGSSVNIIDLGNEQVIGSVDNMKGVHGIAIDNELNRGFITDGRGNSVVVFDLKTFRKILTIPVTPKGPDGVLYDDYSKRVFAFCGDGNAASVIDASTLKEIGTVHLGGGPEFAVANGKGLIYNNLEDKNSLDVIDSKTMKVIRNYSLSPCSGPTGLALDAAHQRLFTVCRENKGMSVVDISTGQVISTLPIGAGVDAVCYDPVTQLIFCSNGDGTATIIKQKSANDYSVVQTLSTPIRAKTMALDPITHKIYFSSAKFETGTRNVIPSSFSISVYKMN